MNKLINNIEQNYVKYKNLECSEVEQTSANEWDNDIVEYLKINYRFDYKGICVYYVNDTNEIWVENMDA
jgi:hypothetical protein